MELLATYSIKEIITFLIVLGGALAAFLKFYSSMHGYLSAFLKEHEKKTKKEEIANELLSTVKNIDKNITQLEEQVRLLEDSDKDDIKSYILDKYHYHVYKQKWIDDFTYQTLEARYKHYVDEGGNSFITSMMEEIRKLPKEPPPKNKKRRPRKWL